jgi:hypothetical protein
LSRLFWTRITSVFFLGRHYHRICHQLNIYGMNSVDVFVTFKIHRKHYRSCVTHLCTSGTTSHNPLSKDRLVLWVGDAKLSMICSDNDVEKFCWYCLICYAHMNLNYTHFVDFYSLCKQYWASNKCIVSFVD